MATEMNSDRVGRLIVGLDLTRVVATTAKHRRWSPKRAEQAELWYRRHLWLAHLNEDKALGLIAGDADHVWHTHILDTPRYTQDCTKIFGSYLNHVPGVNPAARKTAVDAYRKEFGRLPPRFMDDCWIP